MASNFKIFVHRNNDSLHLKLMGDFDGSSACELISVLKKSAKGVFRVIIHTNSLKKYLSFWPGYISAKPAGVEGSNGSHTIYR